MIFGVSTVPGFGDQAYGDGKARIGRGCGIGIMLDKGRLLLFLFNQSQHRYMQSRSITGPRSQEKASGSITHYPPVDIESHTSRCNHTKPSIRLSYERS